MMYREIGSEFWDSGGGTNASRKDLPSWLDWGTENRFLASGRTALDFIIRDILATQKFQRVYLPSYCCHTMIDPFLAHNIEVEFYDVIINGSGLLEINLEQGQGCDVVLIMNYFGFIQSGFSEIIKQLKMKPSTVVIEDATHSAFCNKRFHEMSDYTYASFRKWFATPGGAIAAKMKSPFLIKAPQNVHTEYVNLRKGAMTSKAQYMNKKSSEKELYLKTFAEAENLLDQDYTDYLIDDLSMSILSRLNVDSLRKKRIQNGRLILEKMVEGKHVQKLISDISDDECPLFIPVKVHPTQRTNLKQYLSKNNVYCPSHWPSSPSHQLNARTIDLYNFELSIVCDQRYDKNHISKMITIINNFTT
ncbi:MAG: hypothetical protein HQ507_12650 [Candidatus Marinimicrobia bacterium]|nr:hypothetical protein [Candidatus Neomarinimicrobiota bacterium]